MKTTVPITLVIADDHELYLEGLLSCFSSEARFRILATCSNGAQLLAAVRRCIPDVVITDLRMPLRPGTEVIGEIQRLYPAVRILALAVAEDEMLIREALAAGARGYITKDAGCKELLHAVETVYHDQPYYGRDDTGKLVRPGNGNDPTNIYGQIFLNETETRIVIAICQDKNVRETAKELFLSDRTIEKHRAIIFRKLNARTAAGVAMYAIRNGLYDLPDDEDEY